MLTSATRQRVEAINERLDQHPNAKFRDVVLVACPNAVWAERLGEFYTLRRGTDTIAERFVDINRFEWEVCGTGGP